MHRTVGSRFVGVAIATLFALCVAGCRTAHFGTYPNDFSDFPNDRFPRLKPLRRLYRISINPTSFAVPIVCSTALTKTIAFTLALMGAIITS